MVLDPVAALLGGDKLGHRGRGPSGRRARRAVAGALDLQVVDRRSRSANSGGPEQLRRRRSKERPFSRDVWGGSTAAGFNDQHLAVYLVEVTGAGRVQRRAARGGAVHKSEGTDPSPPRGGRGNSRLDRLTEEPLSDPAAPSSRRLDRLERGAGALLRRAAPARCPGGPVDALPADPCAAVAGAPWQPRRPPPSRAQQFSDQVPIALHGGSSTRSAFLDGDPARRDPSAQSSCGRKTCIVVPIIQYNRSQWILSVSTRWTAHRSTFSWSAGCVPRSPRDTCSRATDCRRFDSSPSICASTRTPSRACTASSSGAASSRRGAAWVHSSAPRRSRRVHLGNTIAGCTRSSRACWRMPTRPVSPSTT